jgi:hypothetical protein
LPERPFHLAFPIRDIEQARAFYGGLLGCPVGRSAERWIDFDFFGHQITGHLTAQVDDPATNEVDGDQVPVRHFGAVLGWDEWHEWVGRIAGSGVEFLIEPHVRFEGEVGEQATLFLRDPSGNALELKAFRDPERLFARG